MFDLLDNKGYYTEYGLQFEIDVLSKLEPILKNVSKFNQRSSDAQTIITNTINMFFYEQRCGWNKD